MAINQEQVQSAIGNYQRLFLPCELPKDASEDFGNELIKHVLPLMLGVDDLQEIIWHATETTLDGHLTPHFAYLKEYAEGA